MYFLGSIQGLFQTLFPFFELILVTQLAYQLKQVLVLAHLLILSS